MSKAQPEKEKGFLSRYKWFFLIPVVFGVLIWLALALLTENKSVAPFVYATF